MPKYGAGNLPPGMVPGGGGGYGSGSGIAGQNAGNYGDYGYDMPSVVRSPLGTNWLNIAGMSGRDKNRLGVGGPGSYATYLSNTGQLNNPNVYVAPGETAFAATPDYTMYEDYKNGKIQFGMDGRTLGGLGHDLPYGTIYNGVNVNDPGGINNNWGAGTHANHGGVNLENQQGGQNVANQQMPMQSPDWNALAAQGLNPQQIESLKKQYGNRQMGVGGGGWTMAGTGGNQATDPYQLPQGGQLAPGAPQKMGARPPGSGSYKHPSGQVYDESGNPMFPLGASTSNQQQMPTLSSSQSPLQQSQQNVQNMINSGQLFKLPNGRLSTANPDQGPYQMPGGPGQISTVGGGGNIAPGNRNTPGNDIPWQRPPDSGDPSGDWFMGIPRPPGQGSPGWNNGWGQPGPPSAGPRPQQPPLAPGQQQYNGPKIGQAFRPNQSSFGQQNPTMFNQNFAQSPAGQGQLGMQQGGGLQNPYRSKPNQNQFMNTVW